MDKDLAKHPVILAIHEKLSQGSARMDNIEANLATNTELTSEMHDWLRVGKSGLRVLGMLGRMFGWLISVAAGLAALYGGYQNWLKK